MGSSAHGGTGRQIEQWWPTGVRSPLRRAAGGLQGAVRREVAGAARGGRRVTRRDVAVAARDGRSPGRRTAGGCRGFRWREWTRRPPHRGAGQEISPAGAPRPPMVEEMGRLGHRRGWRGPPRQPVEEERGAAAASGGREGIRGCRWGRRGGAATAGRGGEGHRGGRSWKGRAPPPSVLVGSGSGEGWTRSRARG